MYSGPVPQPIRSASTCGLTVTSVRPLAWLSLTARRSCIAVLLASNRSAIFSLPLFGYMTSLTSLHTPCAAPRRTHKIPTAAQRLRLYLQPTNEQPSEPYKAELAALRIIETGLETPLQAARPTNFLIPPPVWEEGL